MKLKKLSILSSLCLSISVYANDDKKAEEFLHHFGIAHCLSHSNEYKKESALAKGGYFQLGEQSVEDQKQIEAFIDEKLEKNLTTYQISGQKAYLMQCLDISYSKEYQEYVHHILDYPR